MDTPRAVTIHMDREQISDMQDLTDCKDWYRAVGYLSTWNLTYPICNIFADGKTDMVAVYKTTTGERGYTIGAVWHGDHYGFHS